jgi:hypothetical protein
MFWDLQEDRATLRSDLSACSAGLWGGTFGCPRPNRAWPKAINLRERSERSDNRTAVEMWEGRSRSFHISIFQYLGRAAGRVGKPLRLFHASSG